MTENKRYILGDDSAGKNPWRDDKLGYAPFAARLAKTIINLEVPNGFVIGLHGQWGSGKTTLINFVNAHVDKHNQEAEVETDKIEILDFQPWIVAGHQDLVAAFFKVLSESLGPRDGWWLRKWKGFLRIFRGTSDTLVDSVAKVAVTVDPTAGVATGSVGDLVKGWVNRPIDKFLEEPSLQAAHKNLEAQLAKTGRRFLVNIDDLDRLEDQEVRSMVQMVKTVGRLPNVIYILAYDREIVWRALDGGVVDRIGPRFAEKIVQQELELPKPGRHALLAMLDKEIDFLVGATEGSTRWSYISLDGIVRWMRSPRNVLRLANAVKFSWPALENEIDPHDLLAIEGLRLFDEAAFNWVRDNRDFFFDDGRFRFAKDEVRQASVDNLKRRISGETDFQILRILSVLFPQSSKWLEGNDSVGEDFVEIAKRRGIASEAGYDAYFGMHPSSDAVPRVVIMDLMLHLDDTDYVESIMRSYLGKQNSRGEHMIAKLLDELRIQFRGSKPARPTQALLVALFRVGEEINRVVTFETMFTLSPRQQMSFLVRNMLEQWGEEDAGHNLVEAFQKSTSPFFMADIYIDRGRELGIIKSVSSERPVIKLEDLEKLGQILLGKIHTAVDDETLAAAPFYYDIVRAWESAGEAEAARNWISAGLTESAEFMVKVCRGLVSYTVGTSERRYTMRDVPDPKLYDLSLLFNAGRVHLGNPKLAQDERSLLAAVVKGTERLMSGASPEDLEDLD